MRIFYTLLIYFSGIIQLCIKVLRRLKTIVKNRYKIAVRKDTIHGGINFISMLSAAKIELASFLANKKSNMVLFVKMKIISKQPKTSLSGFFFSYVHIVIFEETNNISCYTLQCTLKKIINNK